MDPASSVPQGELNVDELVLLVDRKDRRYLFKLKAGGEFHSHSGSVAHDDLIGGPAGIHVKSSGGGTYLVIRPTLADFVLKMPRGAQIIYPKDIGPIMLMADVFPGARVFESGIGSGALSTALLRSGAIVHGHEIREDFAERAKQNVTTFLGEEALARYSVTICDAYEGLHVSAVDRAILDLPEPWQVVPHLTEALVPGGVVVAYTPSILQATRVRDALETGPYAMVSTTEVLNRGWHIDGHAVRPDHRMVAHTGFLTSARRIEQTD
ncbi:MAG: tRNA (adenine-N1)-methyltransferase [Acidimicrobiales bacterium]